MCINKSQYKLALEAVERFKNNQPLDKEQTKMLLELKFPKERIKEYVPS